MTKGALFPGGPLEDFARQSTPLTKDRSVRGWRGIDANSSVESAV